MGTNKLHIKQFDKNNSSEVVELINQAFGKQYSDSKSSLFTQSILLVALHDEKIVGFCAGDELENKTGLLDLLVVHPSFQNLGIGSLLFKARMTAFSKLHITKFVLYHWVKTQLPEPKIAVAHGFKLKEVVANYWQQESLKVGYHCKECGPPPCTCACHVYERSQ